MPKVNIAYHFILQEAIMINKKGQRENTVVLYTYYLEIAKNVIQDTIIIKNAEKSQKKRK